MTAIEEVSDIERGIRAIIDLANKEVLVIKSPEYKLKVESAVRGVIEAYADKKVTALSQQHEREIVEAKRDVLKHLTQQDRFTNRDSYAHKLISEYDEWLQQQSNRGKNHDS